jgi:hypothetical protein
MGAREMRADGAGNDPWEFFSGSSIVTCHVVEEQMSIKLLKKILQLVWKWRVQLLVWSPLKNQGLHVLMISWRIRIVEHSEAMHITWLKFGINSAAQLNESTDITNWATVLFYVSCIWIWEDDFMGELLWCFIQLCSSTSIVLFFYLKQRFGDWILSPCSGKNLLNWTQSIELVHIFRQKYQHKIGSNWVGFYLTTETESSDDE